MSENKELMQEVTELKEKLAGISEKKEKSDAEKVEYKSIQEEVAKLTAQMAENSEKSAAEIKELKAKMQTPEVGESKGDAEQMFRKQAFATLLRKGDKGLSPEEMKALRTDSDPQGGYLTDSEFADFVATRVFETSPIRQVANVVTMNQASLEVLIDDDEAGAGWSGEGSTNGETSTPNLGKIIIHAHKLEAEPKISSEMIADSRLDIEAWLRGKVANKFGRVQNSAFFNGDGVAKPRGILTYADVDTAGTYQKDRIERIASGASGAVSADGLIELQNALKEEYQQNAVFFMKRATWGAISKLKDSDNRYLVDAMGSGISGDKMRPMLLGREVIFADDMPAVSAGNLAEAYGDFSRAYTIADREGISVLVDPYSSKGFVEYYTTQRVGGGVTNFDALKLMEIDS